jgi:hypothetical protein
VLGRQRIYGHWVGLVSGLVLMVIW